MAHALYSKVVTITAPTPPAIYLRSSTGFSSSMVVLYTTCPYALSLRYTYVCEHYMVQ